MASLSESSDAHRGKRPRGTVPKSVALMMGLALLLISVGIQAVWYYNVYANDSISGLYAESYSIGDAFDVTSTSISVAKDTLTPVGTQNSPLEIDDGMPEGNVAVTALHWVYTVTVQERTAGQLSSGNFTVHLEVNGTNLQPIYLTQQVPDASKVEGAVLAWDLGSSIPSNPLFVLQVRATVPPAGPTYNYTMDAVFTGWAGNSTGIFNQTNPTFNISAGDTLHFTIRGGDGMTHNLQIRTSGGTTLATSADVDQGQTTTLTYTFTSAGTYSYRCQYHGSSMVGTINVT